MYLEKCLTRAFKWKNNSWPSLRDYTPTIIFHLIATLCLQGGIMQAPWNGEKVNLFIRSLAIIFIICALIAFSSLLIAFFERGNVSFDNLDFRAVFGMLSAPYCFLLFLKVAVTGHAPKSWIPWK